MTFPWSESPDGPSTEGGGFVEEVPEKRAGNIAG